MQHTIELPCTASQVARALDEIEAFLESQGMSSELVLEMRLIGEETLTNVVKYAGASSMVVLLRLEDGAVVLEVRDDGRPFDPLEAQPPNLEAELEDRQLGGLGIHLIHSLCEEVRYVRDGDANVLRLTKKR